MTVVPDLENLWSAALIRKSSSAFRTAATGVQCVDGPALVGVDGADRRVLLLPIPSGRTLKEDVDGEAVVLRRLPLEDDRTYRVYACLQLMDDRQRDLFTALCEEVLDRVAISPDRAVASLRSALSDWRALLSGTRDVLSSTELAGLFGELWVLRELLSVDRGTATAWTGPEGSAQDFHRGVDAIEVKTTTSSEGRRVRINGIDQLDIAASGRLVLRWFRLGTGAGRSVPELVDEIMTMTDDPPIVRRLLSRCGYHEAHRKYYERRPFEVIEERAYDVGPGFPRITADGLRGDAAAAGIGPVEYALDLDCAPAEAARLDAAALSRFMERS